ncbi:hypothetical protein AbraIFM66951_011853 [Aspergillus brasiliensis]|uniref:Phenylalanine ammonia-lyase n=1 Tax=Aspergillus brasiliensis TaxID=319629 RepID=A0A9W5YVF5_9EURO|nr:hypothetical protein AbraCBS73388_011729 [Aspergillus brasiliensis]GKZ48098.1 hypothetical protein AbraIFM66951_011853 [Aspergillus brasiliensis]
MADTPSSVSPDSSIQSHAEAMLATLTKTEHPLNKARAAKHKPFDFTVSVLDATSKLESILIIAKKVSLSGHRLDLAEVVAVAKHGVTPVICDDGTIRPKMQSSVGFLSKHLQEGNTVYGVNTGFGGSADTRSDNYRALQKALVQHHNAGVLLPAEQGLESTPVQDRMKKHCMPAPYVKAAMLVRCNSLVNGHSAVRPVVIRHILKMAAADFTPVVPLRGSISASGDLTPLAYIAGAVEGNPDIFVDCGPKNNNMILPSDEALAKLSLKPISFFPKEGLGLLNGTAFSAGSASLVIFEANQLAVFAQVVTAMFTEALMGTRRNFHPFISSTRPHPGQREVARNLYRLLEDSKLATDSNPEEAGLAQDRYAIRTTPQWIGPQLESLVLATRQVEIELNSTTDNPLLDTANGEVHHGGNYQAVSVTSAMEKVMTCMQMLGKMVFAQCSELLNPMFSKGLPPNLCADDPNLSFAFKGVDINMASYMSELGYLAHPVSNFVQSAEMHNQSLNSLALLAARYAGDTVEILSLMVATHLYVLCQALDLRTLQLEFEKSAKHSVDEATTAICKDVVPEERIPHIEEEIWKVLMQHWAKNANLSLASRATTSTTNALGTLMNLITDECDETKTAEIPGKILLWQEEVKSKLCDEYEMTREKYFLDPSTPDYLCSASIRLYNYVRKTLEVPMHKGIVDHPTFLPPHTIHSEKHTIGSLISTIYVDLREGDLMHALKGCFEVPKTDGVGKDDESENDRQEL